MSITFCSSVVFVVLVHGVAGEDAGDDELLGGGVVVHLDQLGHKGGLVPERLNSD